MILPVLNHDDVELDIIDYGAEDLTWDDENNELNWPKLLFADFGAMQARIRREKIYVNRNYFNKKKKHIFPTN